MKKLFLLLLVLSLSSSAFGAVSQVYVEAKPAGPHTIQDTAALSNVSASATVVTVLAANPARVGFALYNDSGSYVYVKFGSSASSSSFTLKMAPNSVWHVPQASYSGVITGIWESATGTMRVTEL
jgi:hypothetical protein